MDTATLHPENLPFYIQMALGYVCAKQLKHMIDALNI